MDTYDYYEAWLGRALLLAYVYRDFAMLSKRNMLLIRLKISPFPIRGRNRD